MKHDVFGVRVSPLRMHELVERLAREDGNRPRMVFTMNLDHVVQMQRNPQFCDAYASADVVTIDGAPVLAYARARGAAVEKVTGSDLFEKLIPRLVPGQHRLFFALSSRALCDLMRDRLMAGGFAPDALAFAVPPLGFEYDVAASRELAMQVRAFAPTHTFLCVGSPKSEIWCMRHRDALGDSTALCVGASAEFHLGVKRRAPALMRRSGLEWLWRWMQEPRRLFRRYFVSSWRFFGAVWADILPRHR